MILFGFDQHFKVLFLRTSEFSFTFANVSLMVDFSFSTVHIRSTLFIRLLKQIVDSILVPFRWVTAHRERCFTVGYAIDLVRLWDLCQSPAPSQCHKVFPTAKIAQVNSYFVFSLAEFVLGGNEKWRIGEAKQNNRIKHWYLVRIEG